ncbi:MAG: hypothetical protein LKM43_04790 [Wolbachia endosymbiont of Penenirmus auritus]|nr:hypothetical protein [Wolbachia endosymbiont of Penenirmus auritus]
MDDTHNFVIPARDAGIQEFYQVGEHKSYVKMHHFYGKLDPSVKHWDDKKRGYWNDKKRKYWDDKRRGYLHDTLQRLLN